MRHEEVANPRPRIGELPLRIGACRLEVLSIIATMRSRRS